MTDSADGASSMEREVTAIDDAEYEGLRREVVQRDHELQ